MSDESHGEEEIELTGDQAIELVDAAIRATGEAAEYAADEFDDDLVDRFIRERMQKGFDQADPTQRRREFAIVAANVADDRYGAGSTAAAAALGIALRCGFRTAIDFVRDLEHHEQR